MNQRASEDDSALTHWKVTRQNDGSVNLVRINDATSGCGFYLAAPFIALALAGLLDYFTDISFLVWNDGKVQPAFWEIGVIYAVGAVFLCRQMWLSWGHEEWRVSSNRLEIRRTLWLYRTTKIWTDATLEICYACGDTSQNEVAGVHGADLIVKSSPKSYLLERLDGEGSASEIQAIGSLLSQVTGWKLQISPDEAAQKTKVH